MQLKIRLIGVSPMVWRRVLVPVSATRRELPHTLRCSPLFYNNWSTVRGFAQIERRNIPVKDSITSKATFRFTEGLGYELRPVGAN